MDENNEDLTNVISIILRTAVILSMGFIVSGVIMLMINGGGDGHTLSQISSYNTTSPSTLKSNLVPLSNLPEGIISLDGIYFIAMGLWILIFTPVIILISAVIDFVISKNYLYVLLSAIVLTNLTVAIFYIGPYLHIIA
ncbi:MAG: DUF1634 domain-containing protein [Thermoplasmataceae archaeon]